MQADLTKKGTYLVKWRRLGFGLGFAALGAVADMHSILNHLTPF